MRKELNLHGLDATKRLADHIAQYVFPGFVLGLEGDLGAGKTTFTQFFGRALGVTDAINSPTFTIMKHYTGNHALTHIDAYRLEGAGADESIEEYIFGKGVSVVEWWTYIRQSMPETFLTMHMTFVDETTRHVVIEGSGRYARIIADLDA